MALQATIKRQVKATFDRYLRDLAQDVSLTSREASSYNFATGETTIENNATSTVKGVLLENQKAAGDGNRLENRLLINSSDVEDFSVYANITIGDKVYRVESYTDNGYVITAVVSGG